MPTTSIIVRETPLVALALRRGDDALVLGHRLSEWCGHAPMLEEDLALSNLALDLIGQARSLFSLAGAAEGDGHGEDDFAYLRDVPQYRNLLMLELPNGDFAHTIVRQLLFSAFIDPWWRLAVSSAEPGLAEIAAKAEKESAYHLRHAAEWVIRLGDGTEESHRRAQQALDQLWPYTGEMFAPEHPGLVAAGLCPDPPSLRPSWDTTIANVLAEARLDRPKDGWMQTGGRIGRHTEHLGHLLSELQYLQRSHPGATW
jgi:ring-1,2-phenylacetyl-CoA epoxidase subunit PaaC